jgi:hypothetical protein
LTFGEFLQHFPMLDKASMHFRFQSEDPTYGYVWEDIRESSKQLPTYQGNIFVKILRTGKEASEKRKIILRRRNIDPGNPLVQTMLAQTSNRPTSTSRSTSAPASASRGPEDVSNRQDRAPAPPKPSKPQAKPVASSESPIPSQAQAKEAATAPNFFDTDSDNRSAPPSYSPHPDILNFDDAVPIASSSAKMKSSTGSSRSPVNVSASTLDIDDSNLYSGNGGGGELSRAELAARKEEAIEDKVRSALEFKKEVDQKKEREQLEFDSAKVKHEQALNTWATNNKEKRNVRTLLSTMHNVLPSDSKWKALGLGDVLEPSQVKKAYRKAMLVVHPDHCINLDSEHKFICKRVFEALNEAYDEFTKKENV